MTNPRTLLLSIVTTACCFILTLLGVAGPAPIAPTPAVAAATAPGLVSAVSQDANRFDPGTFAVAREPAVSSLAPVLDAADRNDGPNSRHGRARRP